MTDAPQGTTAPVVWFVAYYFPPLTGMASNRAVRIARGLTETGWGVRVFAPRTGMYHRAGDAEESVPGVDVVRTDSLELSRVFRRGFGGEREDRGGSVGSLEPVAVGALGGIGRALVREFLYLPDSQIGWFPYVMAEAKRRIVHDGRPSVIFTSSVPYTSHFVGRSLKRRFGIPWVAEFRDLWSERQMDRPMTPLRRGWDLRQERSIVQEADAIVTTTAFAAGRLGAAHPGLAEDRIHVVTNAYDEGVYPPPKAPGPEEPLVLVHAGTIDATTQDPAPLLRAIAAVRATEGDAIRLRLFGPERPWASALESVPEAAEAVEVRGLIPPSAVPSELMACSAMLILTPGEAYRNVIAGKAFEWLGSRLPLLAIADGAGEVAALVRRAGGLLMPSNTSGTIEEGLRELVVRHRRGQLHLLRPSEAVRARFSNVRVVAGLSDVLHGVREAGGAR